MFRSNAPVVLANKERKRFQKPLQLN